MLISTRFVGTKRGEMTYLFFLLTEDYIEEHVKMSETLEPLLTEFARDIGDAGALVRPFRGNVDATQHDILSKNWADRERGRIQLTPGILVIDVDFDGFNPRSHRWLHISLRDSMNRYGEVSIFDLHEIFSRLAECCRGKTSLFDLADDFARKRIAEELYESFELKPGIFGCSVDVKRGIEFLYRLVRGVP